MKTALILLALLSFASLCGLAATLEITIKDAKAALLEDAAYAQAAPLRFPAK